MGLDSDDIWRPTAGYIENAQVTALSQQLNVANFDALYDLSVEAPDAYWRALMQFCAVRWSRDYLQYCDVSRGKPFPNWFVGGELNWVDMILANAAAAERTAIVGETEDGSCHELTYGELDNEIRSYAAGFLGIGLHRGDRVGLLMENGIEASVSLLALAYIGAIAVPLFSGFGAGAIISRLGQCDARALIVTSGFRRRGRFVSMSEAVAAVKDALPRLEMVITKCAATDPSSTQDAATTHDWHTIRQPADSAPPAARMSANDPFMVIFTSGTTGKPKGIVHIHGGFPIRIVHDAAIHFDVAPGEVLCWPADMGWIAGPITLCAALLRGATLVCYDGAPDFPDWSRIAQLVEKYGITHLGASPTLIRGFAANELASTQPNVASLRVLITAGESIAPDHFVWFERHFGGGECPLINYTGGTEVSGALLSSVVTKPIVPAGFNARAPGIEVDVVDPNGNPLIGATGELVIHTPFVGMTASFWEDKQRYLDTYWRTLPGIWVHGDLAMQTEEGHYFLLGRSDDTLKVAGKRLGPAEVEEILLEIDGVVEAAVIGADDPAKGHAIIAFLSYSGPAEDIQSMAASRVEERLGRAFKPRAVFVVPELPKTRSSKIMRRVIRGIFSGEKPGEYSSLVNPESVTEIEQAIRQQ